MEKKLLCNFLIITMYVPTSIYNIRKRTTFELTPPFLLEKYSPIYQTCVFPRQRFYIIFCFENHEDQRGHREKWQTSAYSVYTVVYYLCKYSFFPEEIKKSPRHID